MVILALVILSPGHDRPIKIFLLVLALIGVLIVETWLAGRLTRARSARVEALAT